MLLRFTYSEACEIKTKQGSLYFVPQSLQVELLFLTISAIFFLAQIDKLSKWESSICPWHVIVFYKTPYICSSQIDALIILHFYEIVEIINYVI